MEQVRLKNGISEDVVLVNCVVRSLQILRRDTPMAIATLIAFAKRHGGQNWRNSMGNDPDVGHLLQTDAAGTVTMHDSIRHIVLSAVEGEGANWRLVDPRDPPPTAPAEEPE